MLSSFVDSSSLMPQAGSGTPWRRWLLRAAAWAVLANLALAVFVTGYRFRQRMWVETEPVRMKGELDESFRWGQYTVEQMHRQTGDSPAGGTLRQWGRFLKAYVSVYTTREREAAGGNYGLDRAPLRLLVESVWAWQFDGVRPAQWSRDAVALPLRMSLICQLAGAVGLFFLVRHWVRRQQKHRESKGEEIWWMDNAPAGALLVTVVALLNPALAMYSRGMIPWDIFFLPLFGLVVWAVAPRWPAVITMAAAAWIVPAVLVGVSTAWGLIPSDPNLSLFKYWFTKGAWTISTASWEHFELKIGLAYAVALFVAATADRATILALLAACLMWMDPATVLYSNGYPGWDLWFVPLLVFAFWAASADRWVIAGMLAAAGVMIEPKMLLGAPVLALWPLFSGRIVAFVRLITGVALGAAIITSPWILRGGAAWTVTLLVAAAAVGGSIALRKWRPKWKLQYAVVAVATLLIWLCAWRFDGSMGWYHMAFEYPMQAHPTLSRGAGNLPGLMKDKYGWELRGPASVAELGRWAGPWATEKARDIFQTVHATSAVKWVDEGATVGLETLLRLGYAISVILCGIGAAIHARRNSARILVAMVAPFVLMFGLLGQMSDRDLVFAAALGAAAAGASAGMTLMWLVVTAMSSGMMLWTMIRTSGQQMLLPQWWKLIDTSRQGYGWMMIVVTGAYLCAAMMWEAKAMPEEEGPVAPAAPVEEGATAAVPAPVTP